MRHKRTRRRIQRNFSHRKQLLENLVYQLFQYQQIRTTWVKAKEAQKLADQLITIGKVDSVHARRKVFQVLGSRQVTTNLFSDIAPRFSERRGGYTRVLHLGHRKGDAAPMALLELTEKKIIEPKKSTAKKTKQTAETSKEAKTQTTQTKERSKPEAAPQKLPQTPKKQAHPKKQSQQGFFGRVKTFFRRKGPG